MGWMMGLEPTTPRATTWYSSLLSYIHHIYLVRLKGLEPLAHCLEGSCSIHLSYRRTSNLLGSQQIARISIPFLSWFDKGEEQFLWVFC